jgi:hypothetical protein
MALGHLKTAPHKLRGFTAAILLHFSANAAKPSFHLLVPGMANGAKYAVIQYGITAHGTFRRKQKIPYTHSYFAKMKESPV